MHNRKLGRTADHRKALFRNLATDMIKYEKIETTEKKALEMRTIMDELVTLAKKGDLHARRQVLSFVHDGPVDNKAGKTVVQKLFDEIGPRYTTRNGGYTRVVKTGVRKGDAAPMAYIEFVK